MPTGNREWRANRWIAAILALLVPPLGMLYVGRVRLAVIYFVLGNVVAVAELALRWHLGVAWLTYVTFSPLVNLACAIHAFTIAKNQNPTSVRRWYTRWYGLVAVPAVLFMLIFGFRAFLYEPFRVPAASMAPTLETGSVVVTQKWGYGNYGTYGIKLLKMGRAATIQRGDILVFEFPPDPAIYYVKRVVGLPGDRVRYQNGRLFINSAAVTTASVSSSEETDILEESLDGNVYRVANSRTRPSPDFEYTVPASSYFVLGDNRDHSNDSRYWGFVPEANLVSKVVYVFTKQAAVPR